MPHAVHLIDSAKGQSNFIVFVPEGESLRHTSIIAVNISETAPTSDDCSTSLTRCASLVCLPAARRSHFVNAMSDRRHTHPFHFAQRLGRYFCLHMPHPHLPFDGFHLCLHLAFTLNKKSFLLRISTVTLCETFSQCCSAFVHLKAEVSEALFFSLASLRYKSQRNQLFPISGQFWRDQRFRTRTASLNLGTSSRGRHLDVYRVSQKFALTKTWTTSHLETFLTVETRVGSKQPWSN